MIVSLIENKQIYRTVLPEKPSGQYWISDKDIKGNPRELFSIENQDGIWKVKGNKKAVLLYKGQPISSMELEFDQLIQVLTPEKEQAVIYTEKNDLSHNGFKHFAISSDTNISIGKENTNIAYDSPFVSRDHALLSHINNEWYLENHSNVNGTFVNFSRINKRIKLEPGDVIYIMGLRIIVGFNFLAINNPDNAVTLRSGEFKEIAEQKINTEEHEFEMEEENFFFRSPRFKQEIQEIELNVDAPPGLQKDDTVPMALMLGPSLTMALTSVSTAALSTYNAMINNSPLSQILPTILMAAGMLMGSLLWPVLTKKNERKNRIKNEKRRQERYLEYLEDIRNQIENIAQQQKRILIENNILFDECANRIITRDVHLWERTASHNDFLSVCLGKGDKPIKLKLSYPPKRFTMEDDSLQSAMLQLGEEKKTLQDVPISISLEKSRILGLIGAKSMTVNAVQNMIVQLVALQSYDELKIMILSKNKDYDFVRMIPHFFSDKKDSRFIASNSQEVKEISSFIEKTLEERAGASGRNNILLPHYILFCDDADLLNQCDALQVLLKTEANVGYSVVYIAEELKDLPKEVSTVVSIDAKNSSIYDKNSTDGTSTAFCYDRINPEILTRVEKAIANIKLDLQEQKYQLPTKYDFLQMFNVGSIDHLNILQRWKENNPILSLATPIGVDGLGNIINLDLHEKYHGPHGLIAGMTGSGKSEFIISYILSMAVNYHPDEVAFILIDYKGGGLTGAFEDKERGIKLPHLAGTITNLDGASANRALASLHSEKERREAIFSKAKSIANEGTMDIYKYQQLYRQHIVDEPVPHLFIISDEFAELKTQMPEFMEQLISIARVGRSLGVHLILATQKPSGVVDNQIWSNTKFRVCLKVQDKSDSQDMIKRPDAAEIVNAGRFYLQVGYDEIFTLGQSGYSGAAYDPHDINEKKKDESVQVIDNLGRVLIDAKEINTGKKNMNAPLIVETVRYLDKLAKEERIGVKPLWLEPLKPVIYCKEVKEQFAAEIKDKGYNLDVPVGIYDDPYSQYQGLMSIPLSEEGNCLIFGSAGSGKTTLLTTICYELSKNHTPDEVNIYIMDYAAQTLKMFEQMPQVGGVVTSSDDEKTTNLLKMIYQEMEDRKILLGNQGVDFTTYNKINKPLSNIVLIVNNFSGFVETYDNLQGLYDLISRDGTKYGIYCIATANATNQVRFRTQQNFKNTLVLQMNDESEYAYILGRTSTTPGAHPGRGLVKLDDIYEFQSAICSNVEQIATNIRYMANKLSEHYGYSAKRVPSLPDKVEVDYLTSEKYSLSSLPFAVAKQSLEIMRIDLSEYAIYPVFTLDLNDTVPFIRGISKICARLTKTYVVDVNQKMKSEEMVECTLIQKDANNFTHTLFENIKKRNHAYKQSGKDPQSLKDFEEETYVIFGLKEYMQETEGDAKEELSALLQVTETAYKVHFIIVDSSANAAKYNRETWYKEQINSYEGIWVGDGVTQQSLLQYKASSEGAAEDGEQFGYSIHKGKTTKVKLLQEGKEND